jgi:hypothetical protein
VLSEPVDRVRADGEVWRVADQSGGDDLPQDVLTGDVVQLGEVV